MKTNEKLLIFLIIFFPIICFSQNDIIADVVHSNVSCHGLNDGIASVIPTGGTNPYTYIWSNGANTQTIADLSPSSYVVTVTDATGLTATNGTIIQEPEILQASIAVENGLCGEFGAASALVEGGITPYTYIWSTAEETPSIEDLPSGNYKLTVSDRSGCESIADANILIDDKKVEFDVNITAPSCNGLQDGSIDIQMTNGTAPFTFVWDNEISTEDKNNIGKGSYTVFITDVNGCTDGATISIHEPDELKLQFINDDNALIGRVLGGTSPYDYKWSTGLTGTSVLANIGLGTYGLTVTDANGCSIVGEGEYLGPLNNDHSFLTKYLSIGPNPAVDFIQINLELETPRLIEINLFNSVGGLVHHQSYETNKQIKEKISLENISPGLFFLTVYLDGNVLAIEQVVILD